MSKPDACSSSVRERRGGHGRRRRYHARSTRRAGAFRFLPPPPPSFGTKVVRVDRSRPVGLGGAWKQTGACCCRGGCEKAVPFGLGGRRTDLPGGGAQCVGGRVRQWRPCGGGRTAQDTGGATRARIVVACVGVCGFVWKSPLQTFHYLKEHSPARNQLPCGNTRKNSKNSKTLKTLFLGDSLQGTTFPKKQKN